MTVLLLISNYYFHCNKDKRRDQKYYVRHMREVNFSLDAALVWGSCRTRRRPRLNYSHFSPLLPRNVIFLVILLKHVFFKFSYIYKNIITKYTLLTSILLFTNFLVCHRQILVVIIIGNVLLSLLNIIFLNNNNLRSKYLFFVQCTIAIFFF